ncbi:MAG: zf-HC2 domain-containing protein [Acidobacteria bacterium]|nr:zf-HC2 domain-containing protein [Acidobacteriota bacterium]MCA1611768.1 zf-HC2 domain-containing protein [Acidobacteriota bacterium]MCA1617423.1 zf-HC2 domain-containing protein [Acidobacteriota bacterium]
MNPRCHETRSRFDGYLQEALSREERSEVRAHLALCETCRAAASRLHPEILFALLPVESVSTEDAARILDGVRSGIALKAAESRVRRAPRHGRRLGGTAAAAAAAVFIAATLSNPSPASLRASRAPAAAPDRSVRGGDSASAPETISLREGSPADPPAPGISSRAFSPFAEASGPGGQKLPADATIYDWNPGGGQPRVVWIVDRSLDI